MYEYKTRYCTVGMFAVDTAQTKHQKYCIYTVDIQ